MCGVFGILQLNQQKSLSEKMIQIGVERLHHRGPDIRTTWINKAQNVGFGHARLSIIDLSKEGNQPFFTEKKQYSTIANGEIYNFLSLKNELMEKGHSFISQSDCELIPHLYEEEGLNFIAKLDGMFAFSLWDEAKNQLILARDPFGKKPLFYHHQPGEHFIFASELKALTPYLKGTESGLVNQKTINSQSLNTYFKLNYTVGEESIYKTIREVPAGGYLVFDLVNETIESQRYWQWPSQKHTFNFQKYRNESDWINQFKNLFFKAVKKRLMSDVPLGAFLSGGIDSCSVVAAMSALSPETERHTFSIDFEEKSFDTYDHIEALVQTFNLTHHRITFRPEDFVTYFEPVMKQNDGLLADLSLLPMYKLSHEASQHLTVVLTGDGADELLGGYDTYKATHLAKQLGLLKQPAGFIAEKLSQLMPANSQRSKLNPSIILQQLSKALKKGSLQQTHGHWRQIFSSNELTQLLSLKSKEELKILSDDLNPAELTYNTIWQITNGNWLEKAQAIDVAGWMKYSILPKVDRSTMAYSIEARSPFLDRKLAQFCGNIPYSLRIKHPKWILRKAMEEYLPSQVIWQKKSGFNTPLSRWMLEDKAVKELTEYWLFDDVALAHGLFNKSIIRKIWDEHKQKDCHLKLWNIMVFNAWFYYWGQDHS